MAAKICDGLFIGDADSSFDLDFLSMNKIANLINTSGTECPNRYSSQGFVYLTFYWEDTESFCLFEDNESRGRSHESTKPNADLEQRLGVGLQRIKDFIDASLHEGVSVLIFSSRGKGRCAAAACMYLMLRFNWALEKALAFVQSRKPDVQLNKGFLQQLLSLERKLLIRHVQGFSSSSSSSLKFDMRRMKDWDLSACLADLRPNLRPEDKELLSEEILMVGRYVRR